MTAQRRTLALLTTITLGLLGCSGGDDEAVTPPTATDDSTVDAAASAGESGVAGSVGSAAGATSAPPLPISSDPVAAEPDPSDTFAPIPETGVPGLESEDDFCAAWSRFGGTWQVLIQAIAAGQPNAVPALEVIASPTVADAYEELFRVWPSELASERELVADAYFGAFQRRSADALRALKNAGATDAQRAALTALWVEALAGYDPASPPISVVVTPEQQALVDAAVDEFAAARVALLDDPTMEITAETPLTDELLATGCPDQGWIVGQEQ